MQIHSVSLCRAEGKVYEKLHRPGHTRNLPGSGKAVPGPHHDVAL